MQGICLQLAEKGAHVRGVGRFARLDEVGFKGSFLGSFGGGFGGSLFGGAFGFINSIFSVFGGFKFRRVNSVQYLAGYLRGGT